MLFIIGHMGLFFYTQKGSIISTVVLPTTEIIEPNNPPRLLSSRGIICMRLLDFIHSNILRIAPVYLQNLVQRRSVRNQLSVR